MNIFNRMQSRSALLAYAFIVCLTALAGRTLADEGFPGTHDGVIHLLNLAEYERCVDDGEFPCRWAANRGRGYGLPVFNFYPPLPYSLALVFIKLGCSHFVALKVVFFLAMLLGNIGALCLARMLLGGAASTLAATLCTLAPYLALNVFVRGALAETWGYAWVPWVFAGSYAIAKVELPKFWQLLAFALAWAGLLLSHLLTVAMLVLPYAAWLLWLCVRFGWARVWRPMLVTHLVAAGLSAFFVLPSVILKRATQDYALIESGFDFHNNFLSTAKILFGLVPWGYGYFRDPGGMSVRLGPLYWGLIVIGACTVLYRRRTRSDNPPHLHFFWFAVGLGLFGLWMASRTSQPLWDILPFLAYVQFPWRFIGLSTLALAIAAGFVLDLIPSVNFRLAALGALIVATLTMHLDYFRWGSKESIGQTALTNPRTSADYIPGSFDFLPRFVQREVFEGLFATPIPSAVEVEEPSGMVIRDMRKRSHSVAFATQAKSATRVRVNQLDFPGWTVHIDGRTVAKSTRGDALARVGFVVPKGSHRVEVRLERTAIQTSSLVLSIVTLALTLLFSFVLLGKLVRTRYMRRIVHVAYCNGAVAAESPQ